MAVMLVLIGVSLLAGAIGLTTFLWSLANGQYEDLEGCANRILFDDIEPAPAPTPEQAPCAGPTAEDVSIATYHVTGSAAEGRLRLPSSVPYDPQRA